MNIDRTEGAKRNETGHENKEVDFQTTTKYNGISSTINTIEEIWGKLGNERGWCKKWKWDQKQAADKSHPAHKYWILW